MTDGVRGTRRMRGIRCMRNTRCMRSPHSKLLQRALFAK